MPQLDFFSISNQFTWGIFYFVIFYFLVNNFVVPTIFASIFAREFITKNSSADGFENLFYAFTAFYIFNSIISDLSEIIVTASNSQGSVNFNNFVIISNLVEQEISLWPFHPSFEDFDTHTI
jgi:hypothetical protein